MISSQAISHASAAGDKWGVGNASGNGLTGDVSEAGSLFQSLFEDLYGSAASSASGSTATPTGSSSTGISGKNADPSAAPSATGNANTTRAVSGDLNQPSSTALLVQNSLSLLNAAVWIGAPSQTDMTASSTTGAQANGSIAGTNGSGRSGSSPDATSESGPLIEYGVDPTQSEAAAALGAQFSIGAEAALSSTNQPASLDNQTSATSPLTEGSASEYSSAPQAASATTNARGGSGAVPVASLQGQNGLSTPAMQPVFTVTLRQPASDGTQTAASGQAQQPSTNSSPAPVGGPNTGSNMGLRSYQHPIIEPAAQQDEMVAQKAAPQAIPIAGHVSGDAKSNEQTVQAGSQQ